MEISSTDSALRALGVEFPGVITDRQRRDLDDLGFCMFEFDDADWLKLGVDLAYVRAAVDRISSREGWRGGLEGKEDFLKSKKPLESGARRLGNLVDKDPVFKRIALCPAILEASHHVAGEIKLSSLNYRDPNPGAGAQRLHVDWVARQRRTEPFGGCIGFLYLDDVTTDNGPARVVPGSHRVLNWPDAHADVNAKHPDEVYITAKAGWLAAVNLHVWHSGTENFSGARRRALNITYRRRTIPQFLDPRRFLSEKTLSTLSDAEAYLFAVRDGDPLQEAEYVGPGAAYREWLARDPVRNV
jgi:hypothetical protein